jgi:pyrimidine deaminase RibD-like protein|tara:strand:- start:2010 stop:2444 length:435 start_codon:yes stop_codon:yes gene_type:complete
MNPRLSVLQSLVNKTIHQTDPVGSCATFANEQEVIYTAFNIPSTTSAVTDWDSHCELQVVDHMSKYDKPIDLYITLSPCNRCGTKLLERYADTGFINSIYTTNIELIKRKDISALNIQYLDVNTDAYIKRLQEEVMWQFIQVAS